MKNRFRRLEKYVYALATLIVFLSFVSWENRTTDLPTFLAVVGAMAIVPIGYTILD
jgi:hypothetical protein